ncbi:hypothetical protein PL321_18030 [Caloramator sp. mosi_1]|uniref:hypothetical protein n=1 Tax=Caloramator sp. mosi_1 TaxID=3023090 RepID=UPI00235DCAA0|nr:hypothetical protein [Caloramator sp. mosi_1]WDC84136.1 hypothetical protein PL321_18030 [Caloramator sp. mosi_1]
MLVSQSVYDELKYLTSKGYEIKIKSGAEIKETTLQNVYGIIEGKNKLYKPIIFAVFFDDEYKIDNNINNKEVNNLISSGIMLEAVRAIQYQKLIKPDRTIIFAFLSGYHQNKIGLNMLQDYFEEYDLVLLENIGNSLNSVINYSKIKEI